ncbi:MAG: glycosyl hydrolase [Bacteroidales bacterium]|nr:glycosyl hydrolase [Bacteroidales bacterium]
MVKKTHRLLFVLLALVAGIIVVFLLTYLGTKSRGPLGNLLDHAGNMVANIENRIILEQRSDPRKERLGWFQPYLSDIDTFSRSKPLLLGVYDNQSSESFENIFNLEKSLNTTFPLIHLYTAWGSKPEQKFPYKQVRAIYELGSVPVITWEPWLTDFDGEKFPGLRKPELRDKGGMADIAKGKYDAYITAWATEAKKMNNTLFIRFGHEMNDPYRYPWGPQNNPPKDFVAAWKHVHKIFTAIGANNVLWVWSPHPSYGWFDVYNPGPQYVDWVGVNILNFGTVAIWSKWWSFEEMFGSYYPELSKFGKPIMITEFGCLSVGGNKANWFKDALSGIPVKYPAIKALLFFHYSADQTTTQQTVDWTILGDTMVISVIAHQISQWPDTLKAATKRTKSNP